MPKKEYRDFRFKPVKKMEYPQIILDWCFWLGDKPTDYRLTEWLLDALPTLYQQDEKIYEYNQWGQDWSKKSCTLFSPIGAISDLWNIEISLSEIKERDQESYNQWRPKGEWWRVSMWVEHIVGCFNKAYGKKLWKSAFYSIDLKDNHLVKKILDKRYSICTGYDWNASYNNDRNADWVLNWTTFGARTYGHAVSAIWSDKKYPARIKDNYYGRKYNIYEVEHEFSEIPCFFARWFVITKVKEDNLERLKELNEMNTLLEIMIENNSKMRHLTNDKNYRAELHNANELNRKKQKDVEKQLILLS